MVSPRLHEHCHYPGCHRRLRDENSVASLSVCLFQYAAEYWTCHELSARRLERIVPVVRIPSAVSLFEQLQTGEEVVKVYIDVDTSRHCRQQIRLTIDPPRPVICMRSMFPTVESLVRLLLVIPTSSANCGKKLQWFASSQVVHQVDMLSAAPQCHCRVIFTGIFWISLTLTN